MNLEGLETRLFAQWLPEGHKLSSILQGALKSRREGPVPPQTAAAAPWPAEHFGLEGAAAYAAASPQAQREILSRCGRSVLEEAYFIEKSGMYFAAKMMLLSESVDERMLYGMFAADEATHLGWIAGALGPGGEPVPGPFIALLDGILRDEGKGVLTHVIQVVLEGWGISHYHRLSESCLDPSLKAVLAAILKDEARHHGSGLVLFNERGATESELSRLVGILQRFLAMVQVGPQTVAGHVAAVAGPLSAAELTDLFIELRAEETTAEKLGTLRGLIRCARHGDRILAELEALGSLRAFTAAECAAVAQPQRRA